MTNSKHYNQERSYREYLIAKKIGEGRIIHETRISKNEIHRITDTGIIIVYNPRWQGVVTKLIARKNQILREYPDCPESVLLLARDHEKRVWHRVR